MANSPVMFIVIILPIEINAALLLVRFLDSTLGNTLKQFV